MSYTSAITFLASAERTEDGSSGEQNLYFADEVLVFLDVTAVGGTSPTLDMTIQTKDANGNWYDLDTFTQATGAGKQARGITIFGQDLRIVYTIGGTTPAVTFSVTGIAKTRG
jgi:hypothetical protein